MKSPRVLLIDLDGTLYFRGTKIPGSEEAIAELRSMGLVLRFLSNTDSRSVSSIARSLVSMGLPLPEEEIFTPETALILFAKLHPEKRFRLLLSNDLLEDLKRKGLTSSDRADFVVVGDVRECVDYPMLDNAFRNIVSGAEIVAMQKGRYFAGPDGPHIDTGAFVKLLEYSTAKEAMVLGKPSREFFNLALRSCSCSGSEAAVVGDDLSTDIVGAKSIGSLGILVKTGKSEGMQPSVGGDGPDIILDSIADLPSVLSHAQWGSSRI